MIINQAARFNFGFASNMVLILWCVCGGLLLHMLEANYLTMLLKPSYEKAIDTAQDILDRNLSVLNLPGSESLVEVWKNSPFEKSRALAERTFVPKVIFCYIEKLNLNLEFSCKTWLEFDDFMRENIIRDGAAVYEFTYLMWWEIDWATNKGKRWYRSKEKKGGRIPFCSYLMNKKWVLEEQLNIHMLRFQQVTVSSILF